MALTADRWARGRAATLVPDAFAVKIEAADGRARGVTLRNTRTGTLTTAEAKVIVLAAGPIETPRLWLNSGLPNPGDEVGRGLTDHYLDFVVGRLPRCTGSSKGPTSAARADFPGYGCLEQAGVAPGLQAQGLTVSDSGMRGYYDNGGPAGAWGADGVASSESGCGASSRTSTG
jgi:hypothetical protein